MFPASFIIYSQKEDFQHSNFSSILNRILFPLFSFWNINVLISRLYIYIRPCLRKRRYVKSSDIWRLTGFTLRLKFLSATSCISNLRDNRLTTKKSLYKLRTHPLSVYLKHNMHRGHSYFFGNVITYFGIVSFLNSFGSPWTATIDISTWNIVPISLKAFRIQGRPKFPFVFHYHAHSTLKIPVPGNNRIIAFSPAICDLEC